MAEERIVIINFRRILKKPRSKRRRVVISFLRKQIARHAKTERISISKAVADALIKVPPQIKVKVITSEGKANVELV